MRFGIVFARGVGKWILRLMQGFFKTDDDVGASDAEQVPQKGMFFFVSLVNLI